MDLVWYQTMSPLVFTIVMAAVFGVIGGIVHIAIDIKKEQLKREYERDNKLP